MNEDNDGEDADIEDEAPLAESETEPNEPESEYVDLPHGKELDDRTARDLTLRSPARLIVIAGPVSSGKTTLLLAIYELLLAGEMPGWLFSGCSTFHGFELRCHPSRVASNRVTAHTERTLTNREDGVHYLHLEMSREESPLLAVDFLFTDLTGEIYEDASHSTEECQDLTFPARADHFILLLDGKKLTSKTKRHSVVQDAATLLRTMLDSRVLGASSFVGVIFTKSDEFPPVGSDADGAAFREKTIHDFSSEFEKRVANLKFSVVAARPRHGSEVSFGHGIVELIDHWSATGPRERKMSLDRVPRISDRDSERFYHRHFEKNEQ